ncbi:MAG: hypothetical protein ABI954_12420 [Pyrinomonadaceae bacterium]
MENGKLETTHTNWMRTIILSAIIGLTVGTGLWFTLNYAPSTTETQIVTGNINRRVVIENTKPVVLNNDLPAIDRQLESVGDKLAEASFHLREQQNEYARQALTEAGQIALKTNDNPQLQQNLLTGIKQAQSELANGKVKEADQEINSLLNELNMPEN